MHKDASNTGTVSPSSVIARYGQRVQLPQLTQTSSTTAEMVFIPQGEFIMGTSEEEAQKRGLQYEIHTGENSRFHPNTVEIEAQGGGLRAREREGQAPRDS